MNKLITIDCRMIDASGIGVYLKGCLPFLLQSNNNFILIGDTKKLNEFGKLQNTKVIECIIKPFSVKELLFFPSKTIKIINKSDIYFSPFFNIPFGIKIPIFTTIHDIIFPDMPELSSKAGFALRMFFYRRAYKKSKIVFTVSNFSKSRIEYHLGTSNKVIVTYNAARNAFLEYKTVNKNIKKENTIIFIGNIKKHKGLDYLLDAFTLAKEEGLPHKLLIIGSKDNFRTSDNAVFKKIDSIKDNSVSITGLISDDKLMELLASSSLLVQPSLYEGFCIPPLEAMVIGTKALISDIPVLKEIYADFPVVYFKAGDTMNLKENIIELLLDKEIKPFCLTDELLDKYSFSKTASVILEHLF